MKDNSKLQNKAINTIRFLSADAVQKANSGHPGLPMGDAAMAYTIWTRYLRLTRLTRIGPIAIVSCFLAGTVPCCCTACYISRGTTCH